MIINDNKHVRGMFLYSEDFKFEKGDFVIVPENSCIYVCNPTGGASYISGVSPIGNENYTPYPGEMITDYSEYLSYLEDPNSVHDKYVSSKLLFEILQKSFFGVSGDGLVVKEIEKDLSDPWSGKNALDDLITSKEMNNGMVKVPREYLNESYGMPGLYIRNNNNQVSNLKYFLVRQHSYKDVNGKLCRVQELIDPQTRSMYLRYYLGDIDPETGDSIISNWKSCIETENSLVEKVTRMEEWYRDMVDHIISNASASTSFRFNQISFSAAYGPSDRFTPDPYVPNGIGVPGKNYLVTDYETLHNNYGVDIFETKSFLITFTISSHQIYVEGSVEDICSACIDIWPCIMYDGDYDVTFNISDSVSIQIMRMPNDYYDRKVISISVPDGYYFVDAFYRYYNS